MKIIRELLVISLLAVPNCATFIANNPGITRALEDYNCRHHISACRQHVEIEVIHYYDHGGSYDYQD